MSENDFNNAKKNFERAKRGNQKAFSETYEVYFKPLYHYVYLKIGNKAESDDLTQDIIINFLNRADGSYPYDSSLAARLYSVARKSVSDWKRKRRRSASFDEMMENYSVNAMIDKTDDKSKEEFENLRKAVENLSNDQQDAVILKFACDLSDEEIGLILDISVRSARRLEAQSLISIRDNLKLQYERQS